MSVPHTDTPLDTVEPLPTRALLHIALLGSGISAALLTAAGLVLGVAYGHPGAGLAWGALFGAIFAVVATTGLMVAAVLDARTRASRTGEGA